MARDRSAPLDVPRGTRRMVEWMLLVGVIVALLLLFAQRVRVLQGQAELAAVKATLGALRTALVIDHLRQNVAFGGPSVALTQRNPFELLQTRPLNYRGEMTMIDAMVAPAGGWVFDPVCNCVGYLPVHGQWRVSPSGDPMAWYQLSGAPGPLELTAKEAYAWQGEVMN